MMNRGVCRGRLWRCCAIGRSLPTYALVMELWDRLERLAPVASPPDARYAVLVPLYEDAFGTYRIIFTGRPKHMRTHPGDVVFPGGGREEGEDAVATAKREAWEEVRLPPENVIEILGGLTPVTTRDRTRLIVPVVARIERPEELIADPSEVHSIIEPPIDHLLDDDRWVTQEWHGHDLWFYEFEEGTLWGATAFMVRELLTYLK
jgi:8-oxo-dGTP pyrophosphatase MutT (NUDIX family)